jgi:hypothetical protein
VNEEREWAIVLEDDDKEMTLGEVLEYYRARGDWMAEAEGEEKFLNKHFLFLGILSGLAAGSVGLAVIVLT